MDKDAAEGWGKLLLVGTALIALCSFIIWVVHFEIVRNIIAGICIVAAIIAILLFIYAMVGSTKDAAKEEGLHGFRISCTFWVILILAIIILGRCTEFITTYGKHF